MEKWLPLDIPSTTANLARLMGASAAAITTATSAITTAYHGTDLAGQSMLFLLMVHIRLGRSDHHRGAQQSHGAKCKHPGSDRPGSPELAGAADLCIVVIGGRGRRRREGAHPSL